MPKNLQGGSVQHDETSTLVAHEQSIDSKKQFTTEQVCHFATTYFPAIAVAIFISKMDPKTSLEIAMASAMAIATGSAPITELVNKKYQLTNLQCQVIAMMSSSFMAAGVGIMEMGVTEGVGKSKSETVLFAGVTGFCLFVATMLLHNFLILCGVIQPDSVVSRGMLTFANTVGCASSVTFGVANGMDKSTRGVAAAGFFVGATGAHLYQLTAAKPAGTNGAAASQIQESTPYGSADKQQEQVGAFV